MGYDRHFMVITTAPQKQCTKQKQKQKSEQIGQPSLVHTGSTTTKRDGPHMASLSGREDTWDNGEKRGRRGVHLESAHPLQEDWGSLCHTVMRMPPLHHLKGHLALHCSASNTKCTHTAFVNLPKHGYSHLFPHHGAVAAAAKQTQRAQICIRPQYMNYEWKVVLIINRKHFDIFVFLHIITPSLFLFCILWYLYYLPIFLKS